MNNMRSWQTRGASLSARRSESSCAMLCLLLLAISCVGCANGPPQSQWLSYEQVRPELRRKIGMERQDFVRACGRLVNVGGFRTADEIGKERMALKALRGDFEGVLSSNNRISAALRAAEAR